jgi:chaperonin GroES
MSGAASYKRLIPLLNRVLVKRVEPMIKSKTGIIMSAKGETVNIGNVVAIGKGNINDEGKFIPINLEVGSTILLPEFGGQKVILEDGDYYLYRD